MRYCEIRKSETSVYLRKEKGWKGSCLFRRIRLRSSWNVSGCWVCCVCFLITLYNLDCTFSITSVNIYKLFTFLNPYPLSKHDLSLHFTQNWTLLCLFVNRYSLKSFAVCLLVVVSLVQQSSSFCQPFNKTSGLAEYCGYSATVNFTHEKHFKTAVKSLRSVARFLSSCSDYAKVIACSVYAPRCEPHIDGPYLPCKRVCDEFNSKCSDRIQRYGLEWIIGMCQLLPEKDDPNTEGYRGRCFVPPGFKTNITKSKLAML